jgi:hypothetical protein
MMSFDGSSDFWVCGGKGKKKKKKKEKKKKTLL